MWSLEKRDKYVYDALYVSRRQAERDYSRRIPVSFTMEKELYDMVEDLIDRKVYNVDGRLAILIFLII